ncbi:hypothetical protein PV325_007442 [Microctonus aethiopoides]|uniref:F-box domain-containing protein n=1 Tax=Microctonus aethiopoides TaxID=144406 RepID=A0AA39FWU2_9HYME|nr:hypothetical protein PV325_007442 [Microctonus aethiopoides]KAK0176674.1 hypothetical protein PV328_000787 [Microctonus aethiopoides]
MRPHSTTSLTRSNMEAYMNMMSATPNPMSADFADILPIELSQMILRHLDGFSLLNAAKVSRKWRNICRGDPRLRQTAQNHIREERRAKLKRAMRLYETTEENAAKYRIISSTSAVAIFFDDALELDANLPIERDFGSRKILAPKRSISKFK